MVPWNLIEQCPTPPPSPPSSGETISRFVDLRNITLKSSTISHFCSLYYQNPHFDSFIEPPPLQPPPFVIYLFIDPGFIRLSSILIPTNIHPFINPDIIHPFYKSWYCLFLYKFWYPLSLYKSWYRLSLYKSWYSLSLYPSWISSIPLFILDIVYPFFHPGYRLSLYPSWILSIPLSILDIVYPFINPDMIVYPFIHPRYRLYLYKSWYDLLSLYKFWYRLSLYPSWISSIIL